MSPCGTSRRFVTEFFRDASAAASPIRDRRSAQSRAISAAKKVSRVFITCRDRMVMRRSQSRPRRASDASAPSRKPSHAAGGRGQDDVHRIENSASRKARLFCIGMNRNCIQQSRFQLQHIMELENWTNDRLASELGLNMTMCAKLHTSNINGQDIVTPKS
jgi:hypothetical protein